MVKILIGVVVVTVLVITTFLILDPNIGITQSAAPIAEVSTNTFMVTVEGEVYKPGTYTLEDNATMANLLEAAGGVTSNADERAYYETAALVNGSTYYIASTYDANDLCNSNAITKVNVNSANAETLTTINGITSTLANSIITYREENGLFSTIEGLQEVYGIGPATYKKVRGYIILHE